MGLFSVKKCKNSKLFIHNVSSIIFSFFFCKQNNVFNFENNISLYCFQATKELYEKRTHEDNQSSRSGAISSSVHDLSPTLWHSLDVWRCTNQLSGGFEEAIKALSQCGLGLANESWVDGVIAVPILAEAAKYNADALRVLQSLAQGIKVIDDGPPSSDRTDSGNNNLHEY